MDMMDNKLTRIHSLPAEVLEKDQHLHFIVVFSVFFERRKKPAGKNFVAWKL